MTRKKTYVIIIIRNRTEGVVAVVKMGAGFTKKILVLGDCQLSDACIQKICKNHGLKKEVLKFIEYSKVKMFDFGALLDTERYSDIFVAASPHKAKNIEGSTSACQFLEDYSERLPKVTTLRLATGSLGLSKTNLDQAILSSQLLENRHNRTKVELIYTIHNE